MPSGRRPPPSARQDIFSCVFPAAALRDAHPTPTATPVIGSSSPQGSFGGPKTGATQRHSKSNPEVLDDELDYARIWHTATSFLRLPDIQITPALIGLPESEIFGSWTASPSKTTDDAIKFLLWHATLAPGHLSNSRANLIDWYKHDIRRHFISLVKPGLLLDLADENAQSALSRILSSLEGAQRIYCFLFQSQFLSRILSLKSSDAEPDARKSLEKTIRHLKTSFQRDLSAVISLSLPQEQFVNTLKRFLLPEATSALGLHDEDPAEGADASDDAMDVDSSAESTQSKQSRITISRVFRKIQAVGLGGPPTQHAAAEVMVTLMSDYIRKFYSGKWESPSRNPQKITWWIENRFTRLIVEMLHQLDQIHASTDPKGWHKDNNISFGDFVKWKEVALEKLGQLRVSELFDIIVDWDSSMGAIEDLKVYVTSPAKRNHLTSSLSKVFATRLLHPGASTSEVLQLYISLIRSFSMLDPQGVLLDRVARPVRRYLREREDTANIIVTGLLSNAEEEDEDSEESNGEDLKILATELSRTADFVKPGLGDDADLDYDNLEWVPDPIDAGPEFKKSKSSDIIGSLISLFDSRDVFVKEFQTIMGERLLRKDFDLQKETRILELLKMRFDESLLQACMVMLRDITDSARVDARIRDDPQLNSKKPASTLSPAQFRTKFLSRLFWPSLHDDEFKIPGEIVHLQERYAHGFESLKQSRKLTWLNALGQVTVELDLEDREIRQEVTTWQATVIYAFQEDEDEDTKDDKKPGNTQPVRRSVRELVEGLDMDESLVRRALIFWVGERVIREEDRDIYSVLESLDESSMGKETAQAAALAAAESEANAGLASVKSADEVAMEKMHVYWQFIVGMLTNRGPMPLQGIIMMLQFAVPGGFPYSSEELREFLEMMVSEDRLIFAAGKYKIK